jgi:hypothetical protein
VIVSLFPYERYEDTGSKGIDRDNCFFVQSTWYASQILVELGDFHVRFPKSTQIPNLMKMRPVGAEIFYADGQTDRQMT